MRRLLSLLIVLSSCLTLQAQIPYEGNRVMSYRNKMVYGVFLSRRSFQLRLTPYDENGNRIDSLSSTFEPNSNRLIGFNIVSGSLGLRLALKVPRLNSDARKSETKEFGLGLAMYKRRYVLEGFYGTYHGLVDRDKEKYDSSLLSDPEDYIRRDIRVQTARLSYVHIRKPDRYSFRASHYFNERMIKSGGSTMFRGRYNYFGASADSAFIPGSGDSLVDHSRMERWRVNSFGAGVGYAYSLVLGSYFFIDAGILVGLDLQWQSYGFNDGSTLSRTVYNPMFDFHFASGWSEDRFYLIFKLAYDLNNLSISSADITSTLLTPSLSFGIRLDPPPEWARMKEEFNFE